MSGATPTSKLFHSTQLLLSITDSSLQFQIDLSDCQHVPTSLDEILKKKTFLKILSPHEFLFLCKLAERLETRTAHQGQFSQKCLEK